MAIEKAEYSPTNQDSPLRKYTNGGVIKISDGLHRKFPRLTPDQISVGGTVAVLVGEVMLARERKRPSPRKAVIAVGVGLKTVGYASDGFDGGLKNAIDRVTPGKIDGKRGDRVDYANDRLQEVATAGIRAAAARQSESKWGNISAQAVEVTTALPSIVKFSRKTRGEVIHEVGNNPASALGSRPGRVALSLINSINPKAQPVLDSIGAVANAYSAIHRIRSTAHDGYTSEQREDAKKSLRLSVGIEATALGHVLYTRSKKRRLSVGIMIAGASVALASTLKEKPVITTKHLIDLQRFIPHEKWGKKQPDHRDALRLVADIVNSRDVQPDVEKILGIYNGIDQDAERILEAREKQIYKGKIAIVTGATGVIGEALVEQLALMGMEIVMCSRDVEKALEVARKISEKTGNENIQVQQLDLLDQDSIVRAVTDIQKEYPDGIDLILNGAGVTPAESKERDMSMEEWIGANYLGPAILTLGLLPKLREKGRVLNLTSSSHHGNTDDFADDIFPEKSKDPYHGAKLLLETLTNVLDNGLTNDKRGIRFISVHPGHVHKRLEGHSIRARISRSERVHALLSTPEEAALGVVRILIKDEVDSRYAFGKPADFPDAVYDPEFQQIVVEATRRNFNDAANELIGV